MASLLQGLKNIKANIGTAASEMQHIANQLQGSGTEEKKFLEAVQEGKAQETAALLTSNPNVIFARTMHHWHNAWHIAAKAGSLSMLEVLHLHGRGATRKPLPGEPPPHAARTRDKRETPLMLACANNHLNAMHYLLGVGADVRDGDKYGNTIVHYAALKGQVKMLSILLAMDEGQVVETSYSSPQTTRLVDMRNEAGLQPLHFAVWGGDPEVVQVLLDHRPDLIAKSISDSMAQVTCNGGSTPLHVAALRNDPGMVKQLLDAYVKAVNDGMGPRQDPRLVADNYKFTPYSLAMDLRREAVLPLLNAVHVLPGLDLVAAAAAAAGLSMAAQRTSANRRRSFTSRKSTSSAGVASTDTHDIYDGFAALAAGADKHLKDKVKVIVPALTPPPPPGAKAGKALAAQLTPTPLPTQPTVPEADCESQEDEAQGCEEGDHEGGQAHEAPRTSIDSSTVCSSRLSVSEPEPESAPSPPPDQAAIPPPTSPSPPACGQAAVCVEHQDQMQGGQGSDADTVHAVQPDQVCSQGPEPQRDVGPPGEGRQVSLTEAAVSNQSSDEQQQQQQSGSQVVLALSEGVSDAAADCCTTSDSPEVSWPASEAAASDCPPGEAQQDDPEYVLLEVRPQPVTSTEVQAGGAPPSVVAEPAVPDAESLSERPSRDLNFIAPLPSSTQGAGGPSNSGARSNSGGEACSSAGSASNIPAEFLCPITNMIMTSPVIAGDGRAYEADALEMWMSLGNKEFPGGGQLISSQAVVPAPELQKQIQEWQAAQCR